MPKLENWIITKNPTKSEVSRRVPGAGLEPARLIQPTDFKSVVSTNSTTQATKISFQKMLEASAGFEPANNGFANRSLKPLGYDANNYIKFTLMGSMRQSTFSYIY